MVDAKNELIDCARSLYPGMVQVPLHAPTFFGNEKEYLAECINSTFVSYVGKYVNQFEQMIAEFTGAKYAVAVVNGTVALHMALKVAGVEENDEVITQVLTFAATANAIVHTGADPVFVDVDLDTMGMSPHSLLKWLKANVEITNKSGKPINRSSKKTISAIVPMHTFGHPCQIDEIIAIADEYNIPVVEDSAESLGSYHKKKHTGTFGIAGVLSFNGNKTITTGGGGMVITDDEAFAKEVKHITTTAKVQHAWDFVHDKVGYNFRMPNINAAIGVAQMENIDEYLNIKRRIANTYANCCKKLNIEYFNEPKSTHSNYWLNCIILEDIKERDEFLQLSNDSGIMTRPAWRLMHQLDMFRNCQRDNLHSSLWLADRIVNLPSGVIRS
jgi:perosamine synthetase